MPASEVVIEPWKRTLLFIAIMITIIGVVIVFWHYLSAAKDALELRDLNIQAQTVLARWSAGDNLSGVIQLSKINSSDVGNCTTVKIYYSNGTLIREISNPC